MKIAILGSGFTGLAAAYQLAKKGHSVSVFEKESQPGGLALGYKKSTWKWTLENYYHHWFTNDNAVLDLAKELNYPFLIKRPLTSVQIGNEVFQLDSPIALLQFSRIPILDRLRMATILAFLRFDPFWKPLEKVTAEKTLQRFMGKKAYESIWKPQLVNKFGTYAPTVSLAWFWARIKKRTPSLAYPEGGFLSFAQALAAAITKNGGKMFYNTPVKKVFAEDKAIVIETTKKETFDKVIVTLPSFGFLKIFPTLPESYTKRLSQLKGLGAMTVVLRLNEKFMKDNTYWLSVCNMTSPIMAIVEHTNFMDRKYYNNEHLVYLGNYLPMDHPYFSMSEKELMREFDPVLRNLNPEYKKHIIGIDIFKVPFAQPIIPVNYSRIMPPFDTPIPNVYLANIQQVYPWDRGTNYAVELGERIAEYITK